MAAPGIDSAAALRGKRIGISRPGSVTDMTARIAVERLGLNPERIMSVHSLNPDRLTSVADIRASLGR
jgi:ABC-type nitrate/sulfonate/bicarbonate transport system substrate-binding protein